MVAQQRLVPALQVLLEDPLFLIGAQQPDVLVAAGDNRLRQLIHGRHVVDADAHVDRIGAHGADLHHRNVGGDERVAGVLRMLDAEQHRRRQL